MKTHRCPWCSRNPRECWILPCLMLEVSLKTNDDNRMRRWAKAAGVTLQNSTTKEVL